MILTNDKKYKGELGKSLRLNESQFVEEPFLQQLEGLKWNVLRLKNTDEAEKSYREKFSETVVKPELRISLKKINSFLTESQIDEIVRKVTTFTSQSLIENNQKILDYLLHNTTVNRNEVTGEANPTVRLIDYDNLENNRFLAISQFKVKIPGTENHIIPDITLFVNGMPLVVVECKSPRIREPLGEAIDQLMRYSEQRNEGVEGNQELFYYNQFLVVTDRTHAKFGTITTNVEKYFFRWTDPYPFTLADFERGGTTPNDQQRLVVGMLDHRNLLDLIQTFTLFTVDDNGNTIKVVGRYQQFRAVKKAVKQLLGGKNPKERSGIIWHTQGSGKSLTMMFMVREMRKHNALKPWKVVFITDRTQLEGQLSGASEGLGYTVHIADNIVKLKALIANSASDLVMGMMQKFQERDLNEIFPILNESPNVLVMTDEAHRTQYKLLGANLRRAIPLATHIAYTGTPIDRTEETFGDYIDKYTMRQSIEDGVTLQIVYEGRTHSGEIKDQKGADKKFADLFTDYNIGERLQILGYGSKQAYLEAETTIRDKSEDMVRHYVSQIFTNGLKAQVVASTREAAIRYKTFLDEALKKVIRELETQNPLGVNIESLKKVETAVVISHSHNDPERYNQFTSKSNHDSSIARFKMKYGKEREGLNGNIGIIVVNNMLLTGFDAPIEQVMYLDQMITDHNLLQAIARVNRIGPEGKEIGFIVDYVGVGNHLRDAIKAYDARENTTDAKTLSDNQDELAKLLEAQRKLNEFLEKHKCTDLNDPDAFFDLFYDEDTRFEYILLFKELTSAFNKLLPRPEALEHFKTYQNYLAINQLASSHLNDSRLSMKGIPDKLRAIADEFLKSKGIDPKIKPIAILDEEFLNQVNKRKRPQTKAAEIEHAIRHYIDLNSDDDPELFASFAQALEAILANFAGNWQKIFEEFKKLRERIKNQEREETYGLERKRQMPFYRIFKSNLFEASELTEEQISILVNLTQTIVNVLEVELSAIGFWDSSAAQNKLVAELKQKFLSEDFIALPNMRQKYNELISRVVELARKNHELIVQ